MSVVIDCSSPLPWHHSWKGRHHYHANVLVNFHGQAVAFGHDDVDHWEEVAQGKKPGHIYSRNTNSVVQTFEEEVRLLEGAGAATSFSTGVAAISDTPEQTGVLQ